MCMLNTHTESAMEKVVSVINSITPKSWRVGDFIREALVTVRSELHTSFIAHTHLSFSYIVLIACISESSAVEASSSIGQLGVTCACLRKHSSFMLETLPACTYMSVFSTHASGMYVCSKVVQT